MWEGDKLNSANVVFKLVHPNRASVVDNNWYTIRWSSDYLFAAISDDVHIYHNHNQNTYSEGRIAWFSMNILIAKPIYVVRVL